MVEPPYVEGMPERAPFRGTWLSLVPELRKYLKGIKSGIIVMIPESELIGHLTW